MALYTVKGAESDKSSDKSAVYFRSLFTRAAGTIYNFIFNDKSICLKLKAKKFKNI